LEYKSNKLHASLETKNDLKAHRRTRIIIRNLPWSCTEDKLKEIMNEFGAVTEVKIPTKEDGRMRGFGFVQFTHPHESAKAINSTKNIDGRKVACDWSLPREVYQEIKEKEEPEPEVESEIESEEDESIKVETDKVKYLNTYYDYKSKIKNGEDQIGELSEDESGNLSEETESEEEPEITENKPEITKKTRPEKRKDATGADVLEGRSVFLRNVPFDATEIEIENICSPYGSWLYSILKISFFAHLNNHLVK